MGFLKIQVLHCLHYRSQDVGLLSGCKEHICLLVSYNFQYLVDKSIYVFFPFVLFR